MIYQSTRDDNVTMKSANAIMQGLSVEGGLFAPTTIPKITTNDITKLLPLSYNQRAKKVLSMFLTDFTEQQLDHCVDSAYTEQKFKSNTITQLKKITSTASMLELWHGPTCAFKDMALQLLPYLLTTSAKITENKDEIIILVATSGDTGKAALEGFCDVDGTRIIVFYPVEGVSPMQKRQMTTQDGSNVNVCAINGNFDDAQTAVKLILTDDKLKHKLADNNQAFSSANSINWGRLVPQVVYYVSAYCDMVNSGEIELGEQINVVVPTGNFGNILASYYAKMMGVPISKLICASNKNNVLTDFINTGVYDREREFSPTISPSMDILISSNLERLLFHISNKDTEHIKSLYNDLAKEGKFQVSEDMKTAIKAHFYAGYCDDEQTKNTIKETFEKSSYLSDTHTAVAIKVYNDYLAKTSDDTKTIIASTANPYKFTTSVLSALEPVLVDDEYQQIERLNIISKLAVPIELSSLKEKSVRFNDTIDKNKIVEYVESML